MDKEILLVREKDGFRVLFGHNRLKAILQVTNELFVDVKWENGRAKVFRTADGIQVSKDSRNLPLKHSTHCNCHAGKAPDQIRHCHTSA
jgi:hypothetical protein